MTTEMKICNWVIHGDLCIKGLFKGNHVLFQLYRY